MYCSVFSSSSRNPYFIGADGYRYIHNVCSMYDIINIANNL